MLNKSLLHLTALRYAAQEIPVFPCLVGSKFPATKRGFLDASYELSQINAWWDEEPAYNLALCPEDAGWAVIDLDGAEGVATWQQLCNQFGAAPTRVVVTPSGGKHLYFIGSIATSARKLGPGVDTRGRGGYVLVPPSVVNGKQYLEGA